MSRGVVDVDYLFRNSSLANLELITKEQIRNIGDRILIAAQSSNMLKYELPSNFSVNNMELAEVQLYVYSHIIEELERRRFKVEYIHDGDKDFLRISWPSQFDNSERARMMQILEKHRKK